MNAGGKQEFEQEWEAMERHQQIAHQHFNRYMKLKGGIIPGSGQLAKLQQAITLLQNIASQHRHQIEEWETYTG